MPRIYDGYSEPWDFCRNCFPRTEAIARERYGDGEGPDDRGNCFDYESDHPDYEDWDDYECCKCGKKLTARDN